MCSLACKGRSVSCRLGLPALLRGAVLFLALASPAGAQPAIEIRVRESDGFARARWPLTVGVPFARGVRQTAGGLALRDDSGAALPVQTRVLATWPDGSVRWMLLDTQLDLRPGQERILRLGPGAVAAAATAGLTVREGAERVEVDSGALRFTIPRDRFALLDGLQPAGEKQPLSGAAASLLVAGERAAAAQAPAAVTILERGPLRTRLALTGTYGNGFDYLVRLDVYAGQPFVRVLHTFTNRQSAPFVSMPRLAIELPLGPLNPSAYRAGVKGSRLRAQRIPAGGARLLQRDNLSAEIDGEPTDRPLQGWIEASSASAAAGIAARWMWQEYPQSFHLRRSGLVYNLWAPEADPAIVGVGASKTHELVIWATRGDQLAPGIGAAIARPLVGVVDPAYLAASGALPLAIPPTDPFVRKANAAAHRYLKRNAQERWNDCGRERCDERGLERPRQGAFGMWNWGDWNFRGYQDTVKGTDSWGNLEYDTAEVLALAYATSGDANLFEAVVAAARHYGDVDIIRAAPARPEWVGMNHPKNPLHFSFQLGGPDLGHTWVQGLVDYYYLTGDERGLESARGIGDYLVRRVQSPLRGNPRQWGWPQIALLALHEATGDGRYLDAAKRYAAGGMAAHRPTSTQQWKLGILADALAETHAATGDAAIRAWLQRYAAGVMQRPHGSDARVFPAVAYVGRLTGDAAMVDAARQRVRRLELGGWGKPFTINGRLGFRISSLLD